MFADVLQNKAGADGSHQVVAELMDMPGGADSTAGHRLNKSRLNATKRHCRMHHRNDHETVPAAKPPQFEEKLFQVPNMIEHQTAEHAIERSAFQRQGLGQIVPEKSDCVGARFRTRAVQHYIRKINGRDLRARGGKPKRVTSSATTNVSNAQTC